MNSLCTEPMNRFAWLIMIHFAICEEISFEVSSCFCLVRTKQNVISYQLLSDVISSCTHRIFFNLVKSNKIWIVVIPKRIPFGPNQSEKGNYNPNLV